MTNKHAQELGKLGGKRSAEVRLGGLSKEQKSEAMRKVRMTAEITAKLNRVGDAFLTALNSVPKDEQF